MARYRFVPERSRVWIDARSNVHPIHSETEGLEGWLEVELQRSGRVNLKVAPRGHLELPVARLRSGNPLEDRELRRRIDARRHPTISGELTRMKASSTAGRYLVSGDVTFKGVTNGYTDEMVLEVVDDSTLRLTGQSTFDIRDFGMEPPRILLLRVEPEVAVRVELVAERQR
jgi:polyisoprenoid-binding protein YceI